MRLPEAEKRAKIDGSRALSPGGVRGNAPRSEELSFCLKVFTFCQKSL